MPGTKQYQKHNQLMSKMADRLGVDLDEAELRGGLTPGERDQMVLRCTSCTNPEECQSWLESHGRADEAPLFCRNGDQLSDLKNGEG